MLRIFSVITTLLFAVSASAQTWVQPQWGMNTAANPYDVSIRLGTQFYSIGTMSSGGIWTPSISNITGTSGHKVPYLDAGNTWAARQTFTLAPRYNALTGYVYCNGSVSDCTASTLVTADTVSGVTTISNAAAGLIGEQISSALAAGSAISLTTGVTANVTSITLTPGDWEVSGAVIFTPAGTTTVTTVSASASIVSATLPSAVDTNGYPTVAIAATLATGVVQRLGITPYRVNVATNTAVYLLAYANFGVSTMTANGVIRARRVR